MKKSHQKFATGIGLEPSTSDSYHSLSYVFGGRTWALIFDKPSWRALLVCCRNGLSEVTGRGRHRCGRFHFVVAAIGIARGLSPVGDATSPTFIHLFVRVRMAASRNGKQPRPGSACASTSTHQWGAESSSLPFHPLGNFARNSADSCSLLVPISAGVHPFQCKFGDEEGMVWRVPLQEEESDSVGRRGQIELVAPWSILSHHMPPIQMLYSHNPTWLRRRTTRFHGELPDICATSFRMAATKKSSISNSWFVEEKVGLILLG